MKATRSKLVIALFAGALLLPLAGCGDNDSDIDFDNDNGSPQPTSTAPGSTPVPTATPVAGATATTVATAAATATAEAPTATPDDGETPTPVPTGAPCSDPSVVVEVSIDTAYGAARIDLQYPAAEVNIPGSGTAPDVVERVEFASSGGLTTVNDDDNTGTLTASLVSFAEQPSGLFATVTFDCTAGAPAAGDFICTVVSASTPGGVGIPDATCSVAVQ
jgi:hypothetical protein